MMGSTEDPADGKAVAGTVFSAVIVYAVCTSGGLGRSMGGVYWNWGMVYAILAGC